jgi:hypothetical protein
MSITGSTDQGDGRRDVTVDHDPRSTATDVPAGSVILYVGSPSGDLWTGCQFVKLDDGATTNVHYVGGRPTLSGSWDLTAGTPANKNIPDAKKIKRITRARFWISQSGFDVGTNTATRIILQFFNTDAFTHAELDTVGEVALIKHYAEFQFASQDVFDIDSTASFVVEDLVRIHDGTNWEFQRIDDVTDADTLSIYNTILRADGDPVWSADDDVTRVLEIRDLGCNDEDYSDEIHLRLLPRTGDNNCRLHYWIEYEGAA